MFGSHTIKSVNMSMAEQDASIAVINEDLPLANNDALMRRQSAGVLQN